MSFLSNAHTHTCLCDGLHTPEEVLRSAQELGFVSLGFSGHGYQGFDPKHSMSSATQQEYMQIIRQMQQEQEAKRAPRIWLGVEEDGFVPRQQREKNRRELDYVIVSTHYLQTDYQGAPVSVDGDPALLRQYVKDVYDGDMMAMVKQYYDLHVTALLSQPVNIIGHFDLVRIYAASHRLFDETSREYRLLALDALERALPCGGILEINTGAIARGKRSDPYPTPELLGAWHDMGGKITITSDCHDATKLNYAFSEATELAKSCGFRTVMRLGRENELFEEEKL